MVHLNIGADRPVVAQHFFDRLPQPLPADPNDLTRRWADAHEDDTERYNDDLDRVVASHRITEATGSDLTEIGKDFGHIGQRRGRGDEEYRAFLLSIAHSFMGRGTLSGLRFAIGAGLQARSDEVTITEHYDHNAYSVTVADWITHKTTTVDMLADLADPSGVELYNPQPGSEVSYQYEDLDIEVGFSESYRDAIINSPDIELTIGFDEATASGPRAGFGAGRFDGEDPFDDAGEFGGPASGQSVDDDSAFEARSQGVDLWPADADVDGESEDESGSEDDDDGSTVAEERTDADADADPAEDDDGASGE